MFDEHYWKAIETKRKGHMELYRKAMYDVLGEEISFSELKQLNRNLQVEILISLENKILLYNSPIDVEYLTTAIQSSRSGIGLAAMTVFECLFCGKMEMWSNTATPNICEVCASNMAEEIAKHYYQNLLKDGYEFSKE